MDINETNKTNIEICENLYKSNLISYDDYLECTGSDEKSLASRNIIDSDIHKFGYKSNENVNDIYQERIYIYHVDAENTPQYLAVLDDNVALTSGGIYNQDNSIFEIEKTGKSAVSIKHLASGMYLAFDVLNNKIHLTPDTKITNNITLQVFKVNGIMKYKFIIKKKTDNKEHIYYININKETGMLTISQEAVDFFWNIETIEVIETPELDQIINTAMKNINNFKNKLKEYYIVNNKIHILEKLKTHINDSVDKVFDEFKAIQFSNEFDIKLNQINYSKQETKQLLNENEMIIINGRISSLQQEKTIIHNDLKILMNDVVNSLNEIQSKTKELDDMSLHTKKEITKYNNTLMNNNILIDSDEFLNKTKKQQKEIVKSNINKTINQKMNRKETITNFSLLSIIVVLGLSIISLFAYKLFNIQKRN